MRNVTRGILGKIDQILVEEDVDSKELWAVLTALRGPDDYELEYTVKAHGTVPVRRKAFPLCAAKADEGSGYIAGADFIPNAYKQQWADSDKSDHVQHYIRLAANALELYSGDRP